MLKIYRASVISNSLLWKACSIQVVFHARALTDPDLGSWSRQKIFRQRPLGTKVVLDVCILLFLQRRDVLFRLIFKNIVLVAASLLKVIDKTLPEKWMDWRASTATCWRVCCKATVKAGRWKTLTVSPVSGSLRGLSRLTAPDVFLDLKHFLIKDQRNLFSNRSGWLSFVGVRNLRFCNCGIRL